MKKRNKKRAALVAAVVFASFALCSCAKVPLANEDGLPEIVQQELTEDDAKITVLYNGPTLENVTKEELLSMSKEEFRDFCLFRCPEVFDQVGKKPEEMTDSNWAALKELLAHALFGAEIFTPTDDDVAPEVSNGDVSTGEPDLETQIQNAMKTQEELLAMTDEEFVAHLQELCLFFGDSFADVEWDSYTPEQLLEMRYAYKEAFSLSK